MHLPDGFINNNFSAGLAAFSGVMIYVALNRVRRLSKKTQLILKKKFAANNGLVITSSLELNQAWKEKIGQKILNAAVLGAFVFSLQMINFPIAKGTSGHFVGAFFLGLMLSPLEGFLIMAIILILQSLVFADGGVLALGANIFNMALPGLIFALICKKIFKKNEKINHAVIFIFAWLAVILAAFLCSLEIFLSGSIGAEVFSAMLKYHLLIGLGEGLITCALVYFLRSEFKKNAVQQE